MIAYVVCYFSCGAVYQSPYELIEAEAESVLAALNSMDPFRVRKGGAEDSLWWLRMQLDGRLCVWRTQGPEFVSTEKRNLTKSIQLNSFEEPMQIALKNWAPKDGGFCWKLLLWQLDLDLCCLCYSLFSQTDAVSSLILSLIYFQIAIEFESRCSLSAKPKSY